MPTYFHNTHRILLGWWGQALMGDLGVAVLQGKGAAEG